MSGAVWAALSGIGFGLFQVLNAKAVRELENAYVSTFLQLVAATVVLGVAALVTEDLSALGEASAWGLIAFTLAGMVHFFVGWTALNLSQARIGAARTSPLLSTAPLFGLAFAAIFFGHLPVWVALAGIALTIAGAYLVADPGGGQRARLADSGFALATAAAWALSPILTVEGLRTLDSPLLGVTLGMLAASVTFGAVLMLSPAPPRLTARARDALALKLFAGLVVALATWGRWVALDGATVGVVLALNLLSIPVVLVLAPLLPGMVPDSATPQIWGGAVLVVLGSLILIVVE